MRIDLNCDLGEGAPHDAELMPLITSANIACGGHAGDATTMRQTVALAERWGVQIGAHPGFADREHFGRREQRLSAGALRELMRTQVDALRQLARVQHVKPHGALYTLAARDRATADVLVAAIREIDATLIVYALAGGELARAARGAGLRVAEEVFGDRTYQPDGALTPRGQADAMIEREEVAVAQVVRMIRAGALRSVAGTDVAIRAETVCLHGDGAHAVEFAVSLRRELARTGVAVRAFTA
ncbi:LamB/YcsF family protein [Horticoccus luteus]|uniref:LamB/YcsF family protein n=1 Tax=Horticoccus luteus TaxID=2862869 RepID=A0A8F9TXQ2_9BACT|nr:5-oxoprolinase subunit PxpA [Horticoccus luteus]QYM80158.1 LamB/YcsF family protein [Horticoccus luteus]